MMALSLSCVLADSSVEFIIQTHTIAYYFESDDCQPKGDVSIKFFPSYSVKLDSFAFCKEITQIIDNSLFENIKTSIAPLLVFDDQELTINSVSMQTFDMQLCFEDLSLTITDTNASVHATEKCSINANYQLQIGAQMYNLARNGDSVFYINQLITDDWLKENCYFIATEVRNSIVYKNLIQEKYQNRVDQDCSIYWNSHSILVDIDMGEMLAENQLQGYETVEFVYVQQYLFTQLFYTLSVSLLRVTQLFHLQFQIDQSQYNMIKSADTEYGMIYLKFKKGDSQLIYSQKGKLFVSNFLDISFGIGTNSIKLITLLAEPQQSDQKCVLQLEIVNEHASNQIYQFQLLVPAQLNVHQYHTIVEKRSPKELTKIAKEIRDSNAQHAYFLICDQQYVEINKDFSYRALDVGIMIFPFLVTLLIVVFSIWLYFFLYPKIEERKEQQQRDYWHAQQQLLKQHQMQDSVRVNRSASSMTQLENQTSKIFNEVETINGPQVSGRKLNSQLIKPQFDDFANIPNESAESGIDLEFDQLEKQMEELRLDVDARNRDFQEGSD